MRSDLVNTNTAHVQKTPAHEHTVFLEVFTFGDNFSGITLVPLLEANHTPTATDDDYGLRAIQIKNHDKNAELLGVLVIKVK